MDKKGNRNNSSISSRGSITDQKKILDVSGAKQVGRSAPRRREPPFGFSKSNNSDTNRKPPPQRNGKIFDKRSRQRGCYSGAVSRNEETCLDDFVEPELGSVFLPGSKKQSLNHLLNFSFAPRECAPNNKFRADKKHDDGKWLVTRKHTYNKNHYLQANCQFIVNQRGDYKQYLQDPDTLVDWNLIEQVNVQVDVEPSCPICLYPPVAAKMTKCGHIYCWPCILHYLALSDKEWRKCPICFDAVKKDDLKSVTVVPHKTFNINDRITFKLMKRLRGSFTAFPAESVIPMEDRLYNISQKNQENGFSKLFSANGENILEILDREDTQLKCLIAEEADCPERCFMDEAVQLLSNRRESVLSESLQSNLNVNDATLELKKSDFSSSPNEAEGAIQMPKFYYFYQAEDGQHIYLHAINAKMIEHTYGSLEFGPKILEGRIFEKEGGSMTDEMRKKLRYLQHLPVTCQFEVAEIELNFPTVSVETLEEFQNQIEMRKKRRHRRAREERKREKEIQVEENKLIGKFETPTLHLENRQQFPGVMESHLMIPERNRTESESTFLTQSERSLSPELNIAEESTYCGPSFAKMLATKKKAAPSWPGLKQKSANQSSCIPVELIRASGSNNKSLTGNSKSDEDDSLECFEAVPNFGRSLGDALAEAMLNTTVDVPVSGGKKKKKKNKHKLLFSTNMAYLEK